MSYAYGYKSPHGTVQIAKESDTDPMPFLIGGIFLLCLLCYCCSSCCSSSLSLMQTLNSEEGLLQMWPFNMLFGSGEGFNPSIDQNDDQRENSTFNWFY